MDSMAYHVRCGAHARFSPRGDPGKRHAIGARGSGSASVRRRRNAPLPVHCAVQGLCCRAPPSWGMGGWALESRSPGGSPRSCGCFPPTQRAAGTPIRPGCCPPPRRPAAERRPAGPRGECPRISCFFGGVAEFNRRVVRAGERLGRKNERGPGSLGLGCPRPASWPFDLREIPHSLQ